MEKYTIDELKQDIKLVVQKLNETTGCNFDAYMMQNEQKVEKL